MVEDLHLPYHHMGATITDGVPQAGLRYETEVWPRVQHVMTIPEAATTSGFLAVLRERGGEGVAYSAASRTLIPPQAELVNQIASIVSHRHLTQVETARVLGTGQPKVSQLLAGKLDGFSIERLIRYLNTLGRDVQIVVTPKPRSRDHATVRVIGKSRSPRSGDAGRAG